MVKAQKFILAHYFENLPKETDLQLVEEELPSVNDGEFLTEAVFLSVDPYMRPYSRRLKLGTTMIGSQVAKIIESKRKDFAVGEHVVGNFGWRTRTLVTKEMFADGATAPYILPDLFKMPLSLGVGMLGMPGNTAYFGFLDICTPKSGETVVVSGAGGAVGSHVGQIAKIKGCKVIGIAGTNKKCDWLKSLGFDETINYKTENIHAALGKVAPNGVDCYFDNVGGEMSSTIIQHMNKFGRVSVCGSISSYNDDNTNLPKVTIIQPSIVFNQLSLKGFIITDLAVDRWVQGIRENLKWIMEGKLQYHETVTEGFKNMPKAFIGMLQGDNVGKAIVKV